MTSEHATLWNRLKSFELDDTDAPLTFTDRLARENGWSHEFSVRAVLEYKKFIFLICVSGQPLTPSDEIDQVWHLHLVYTHSYWKEMCATLLKREIHHGPTRGGASEGSKYTDWYARTLELYPRYFRVNPPADLWPPVQKRFQYISFRRVNTHTHWIIKKPWM